MEKTESLLKWLQTFPIEAPHQTVQQLSDGVAMAQVLHLIDPAYFDESWRTKIKLDCGLNWRLKVSNLKKILKGIVDYYNEILDQQFSGFSLPDVSAIGERGDAEETGRLLQMVLGCAINCTNKQAYIQAIMKLEESIQQVIMKAIQELIPTSRDSSLPVAATGGLGGDSYILQEQQERMAEENRQLAMRCRELEHQLQELQEEKAALQRDLHHHQSRPEPEPGLDPRRQLQLRLDMLQDECYKMEASRDEYKVKSEKLQRDLSDTQAKNEGLQKLADDYRQAQDELDILRNNMEKMAQYETIIESYKKKFEESGDVKKMLKVLEEKNTAYVQQNFELEEEVKRLGGLRAQVEVYKKQAQEFQAKYDEETRRADRAQVEISRFSEKLAALQKDKDRLLAERDSLKETIEELRCDKIQNEPNNMAWESSEMLGILPPPIREQLVRLQHENKMLRLRQEEGGGEQVAVLRSLLDDSERRRNELESENRQANRRLLELEGQLEDLDDMPISHGADLREARAMIDSLESQLQASVEKCFQQQNMLAKKDESMAAMEERYRKYLDKAKNVITSLNTKQHSGMGPAIMTLKNQLAEKDKIIEALEAEVEKTRTLTETEERLITTAFFNLGSQLQRKAAEERLSHSPAPAGQTFLSRQRQASSRRGFNLTEGATSEFYEH